jgi:hypothetical protein
VGKFILWIADQAFSLLQLLGKPDWLSVFLLLRRFHLLVLASKLRNFAEFQFVFLSFRSAEGYRKPS